MTDDLVSATALGWPKGKPFHVFPAMNAEMLSNPATTANLKLLSERGFQVHGTQAGNLACGEEGQGRLLEPEQILQLLKTPMRGKVLVTSGATRESIDGIRFISNVSTGQTGARIADLLSSRGWAVTYLHGEGAMQPARASETLAFQDFKSLDESLRAELQKEAYSAVIHAAAVSDYSVDSVNGKASKSDVKLSSADDALFVELKKNYKILPRLKEYSRNKQIKVIGFKLTLNKSEDETSAIAKDLLRQNADAIVANDWSQVRQDRSRHPGALVTRHSELPFTTLDELAYELNVLIGNKEH
jgi:phosphopantothenoylcysteine decarboxylase/phosphopantothenate--cysteine ligase